MPALFPTLAQGRPYLTIAQQVLTAEELAEKETAADRRVKERPVAGGKVEDQLIPSCYVQEEEVPEPEISRLIYSSLARIQIGLASRLYAIGIVIAATPGTRMLEMLAALSMPWKEVRLVRQRIIKRNLRRNSY